MKKNKNKLEFGTKGIWHKSNNEYSKGGDIPAIVLEETKEGLLYIYVLEQVTKGNRETIQNRVTTIFKRDFTPDIKKWCILCGADLPNNK